MRDAIYRRIDWMWSWRGYNNSRWRPIKELIVESFGFDPRSKEGEREIRDLSLDSLRCQEAVKAMSDGDLLDLFQATTRFFDQQK